MDKICPIPETGDPAEELEVVAAPEPEAVPVGAPQPPAAPEQEVQAPSVESVEDNPSATTWEQRASEPEAEVTRVVGR